MNACFSTSPSKRDPSATGTPATVIFSNPNHYHLVFTVPVWVRTLHNEGGPITAFLTHNWMKSNLMSITILPLAVSIKEAALITTLSQSTLKRLVRAGKLKSLKVGRRRLFLLSDLMAMLEHFRAPGSALAS